MNRFQRAGGVALLGLCWAGVSFGTTRYVDVDCVTSLAPYTNWATASTNIQPVIDASSSGDEIWVAPGVYRIAAELNIPASKTLTLRSTESRAAVIDGQGVCRGITISGTNSVVEGFTVRHGYDPGYGGGVFLSRASTVRDCLMVSNTAYGGGGVMMAAPGLVEDCTIEHNRGTYWGGGVVLYSGQTGVVNRCVIRNNVASNYGGGVAIQGKGSLSNSWITGNTAVLEDAGGVAMDTEGGRAVNCVIANNAAGQDGGGVRLAGGGLAHCTVVSNVASRNGGGVYAANSTSWNSIVYYNEALAYSDVYSGGSEFLFNCSGTDLRGSNWTNSPGFTDVGGGDYHLAAGSSCVDAGTALTPAVNEDLDGNPRPAGGAPDAGAYEYDAGAAAWDAGYSSIGGGWRRLSWFGDYVPMGDWIFHNKQGFWYPAAGSTPANIWFFTQDMGWLYTGNATYPFLYRSSDGAWLWYNGSTNPRWFRNMTAGTWESRP